MYTSEEKIRIISKSNYYAVIQIQAKKPMTFEERLRVFNCFY